MAEYTLQTYGTGYCVLEQNGQLYQITFDTEPDDPCMSIFTTETKQNYIQARIRSRIKQKALFKAMKRSMAEAS